MRGNRLRERLIRNQIAIFDEPRTGHQLTSGPVRRPVVEPRRGQRPRRLDECAWPWARRLLAGGWCLPVLGGAPLALPLRSSSSGRGVMRRAEKLVGNRKCDLLCKGQGVCFSRNMSRKRNLRTLTKLRQAAARRAQQRPLDVQSIMFQGNQIRLYSVLPD